MADLLVEIGDDVLVKLRTGRAQEQAAAAIPVLIKELVSRSDSGIELRQFNPDLTFHVSATEVESVEKVLGEIL